MVDKQSQFWSKVAQKYDYVVDRQIGGTTRLLLRERVAKEERLGSVVEFGCGTGFFTQVLSERADSVVATDISPGMLAIADAQNRANNVRFQVEDCQKTSFQDAAFDTAFMSLVIHFTDPNKTLAEMHRILKPGGILIIANVDPGALNRLDRIRSTLRIIYHGIVGYRVKPPSAFADSLRTESELCGELGESGLKVLTAETIQDRSNSSNIPVDYIRALKM